jgi:hypothetical protein
MRLPPQPPNRQPKRSQSARRNAIAVVSAKTPRPQPQSKDVFATGTPAWRDASCRMKSVLIMAASGWADV